MRNCLRGSARQLAGSPSPLPNARWRRRSPPQSLADLSQLVDVDQPFLAIERQRHRPAAIGTDSANLQIAGMVDGKLAAGFDDEAVKLAEIGVASAVLRSAGGRLAELLGPPSIRFARKPDMWFHWGILFAMEIDLTSVHADHLENLCL